MFATIILLLLTFDAQVESVCHPNYALVPTNAFPAFLPTASGLLDPTETTFQIQMVGYCTTLAQSCFANYHPTIQSLLTLNTYKVPASQWSLQNQSVAALSGLRNCLQILHPDIETGFEPLFQSLGLDLTCAASASDWTSDPQSNCQAVTNVFRTFAENDGWNNFGALNRQNQPQKYNQIAYTDYTNRVPTNPYWSLQNKNRYQQHIDNYWTSQHHPSGANSASGNWYFDYETPQIRWAKVLGLDSITPLTNQYPAPVANYYAPTHTPAHELYFSQIRDVLARSAALTDELKLKAEHFNDKIDLVATLIFTFSQGAPGPISGQVPWTQDDFLFVVPGVDAATYNGMILSFSAKYHFDSIRPVTAIQNVYAAPVVSSWGGLCQGEVNDMPPSDWQSYLRTMQHPEYPSATTCICASVAQYMRRIFGSDQMPVPIVIVHPPGSSSREPGCVPSATTTITYTTWTDWEYECGESRLNAGVHFQSAVNASRVVCPQLGDITYEYYLKYWHGEATEAINPYDRDIYQGS